MLKLYKLAITGQLSSGKTAACAFLSEIGSFVISADEIVHDILSNSTPHIQQVVSTLGNEVLQGEKLSRRKIASIVFNDQNKLKQLEEILHPEVEKRIKEMYNDLVKTENDLFVVDFPLLYTVGMQKWFNSIITIISDVELRKKRFLNKGFSEEQFELRSKALVNHDKQAMNADFIVTNNGTLESLKNEIKNIINLVKKEESNE